MALYTSAGDLIRHAMLEVGGEDFEIDPDTDRPTDDTLTDESNAAYAIWPSVRAMVLNNHLWAFATERVELVQVAGEDSQEYRYVYQHPNPDGGNVQAVYEEGQYPLAPRLTGWTRRGNFLYADFSPAFAAYVRDVAVAALPDQISSVLHLYMCSRVAIPVSYNRSLSVHYKALADEALADALAVNAQSRPSRRLDTGHYIRARYAGYGYRVVR